VASLLAETIVERQVESFFEVRLTGLKLRFDEFLRQPLFPVRVTANPARTPAGLHLYHITQVTYRHLDLTATTCAGRARRYCC
jgi:hypothetical protein